MSDLRSFDFFRISSFTDLSLYANHKSSLRRVCELFVFLVVLLYPCLRTVEPRQTLEVRTEFSKTQFSLSADIEFPKLPCSAIAGVSFQVGLSSNSMTNRPVEARLFNVSDRFRRTVYVPSNPKEDAQAQPTDLFSARLRPKPTDPNAPCEECYGATDMYCCDTCEDVMFAYRARNWALPMKEQIGVCVHQSATPAPSLVAEKRPKSGFDDESSSAGCAVVISATFPEIPGQLHITTTKSAVSFDGVPMTDAHITHHVLRRFMVSSKSEGPGGRTALGRLFTIESNRDANSHQYYISIASGKSKSGQDLYRLYPRYFAIEDTRFLISPGVHFKLDFEPVKVIEHGTNNLEYIKTIVEWLGFFGGFISLVLV